MTLGRHLVLLFWGHALMVGSLVAALSLGIYFALMKPGSELGVENLTRVLHVALPVLPALSVFLGAWITLGRLHSEGSLLALAVHGTRMRSVGAWLMLGALPIAIAAQVLEAVPAGGEASRSTTGTHASGPLPNGGFFFRSGAPGSRRERGAAFLPHEGRLVFGEAPLPPPTSSPHQVRLRVDEEWRLENGELRVVHPTTRELWVGATLRAPRSLVWGPEAQAPDLVTLQRWHAAEPERSDLRFARDSRLRGGARVLALLLVGLAFWLRPSAESYFRRGLPSFLFALGYVVVEIWAGALGVVGEASPTLCAFGPVAALGAFGLVGWWTCDRIR